MLYFAYGSNCMESRMRRRCPSARVVSTAYLPKYSLAFVGASAAWEGKAVATLLPDHAKSKAEGVLYDISIEDLAYLDACEGVSAGVYTRCQKRVIRPDGLVAIAWVYLHTSNAISQPSQRYLVTCLLGREEHNLPTDPILFAY